jgi:hypothetical protein
MPVFSGHSSLRLVVGCSWCWLYMVVNGHPRILIRGVNVRRHRRNRAVLCFVLNRKVPEMVRDVSDTSR